MATKQVKKTAQKRVRRTKLQIEQERNSLLEQIKNNRSDKPIENPIESTIDSTIDNSIESTIDNTVDTTIENNIDSDKINIGDFVNEIKLKEVNENTNLSENSNNKENSIDASIESDLQDTDTSEGKTRKKRAKKDDSQDQFLAQLGIFALEFINDKLCNKIDKFNKDEDKYKFHEGAKSIMAEKLSQTEISKVFDSMSALTAFSIVAIGCTAINVARAFLDKEPQPIEPVKTEVQTKDKKTVQHGK